MDLFVKRDVRRCADGVRQAMATEIDALDDSEVLTRDFDGLVEYFETKYYISPIVLFEDNITVEMEQTRIKKYNRFSSREQDFIIVDGFVITYEVPFDGDSELLLLQPSTSICDRFEVHSLQKPKGESCGRIVFKFTYSAEELKGSKDLDSYVESKFKSKLRPYQEMIDYVNADIEPYNNRLKSDACDLLEKRKERASDIKGIIEALNIPLKLKENALNINRIPLKRVMRKPVAKPDPRTPDSEYRISDDDYNNIVNIIHSACSSMEATPLGFEKFKE